MAQEVTAKEAYNILKKELPKHTITAAADYRHYWLFTAVLDPNKVDYSDPYYVVDKKGGMVYKFTPAADLTGFINAINAHEIDLKTLRG